MKSCTCGGVNENCYRCQGSGEVGRRPGQVGRRVHLRSVVRRRVVRASVQSSRPQVAVSGPLPQQKPTGNTPPEGGELRGAAGKNTAANLQLSSSGRQIAKAYEQQMPLEAQQTQAPRQSRKAGRGGSRYCGSVSATLYIRQTRAPQQTRKAGSRGAAGQDVPAFSGECLAEIATV